MLIAGKYDLFLSNEIISEYEEMIAKKFSLDLADAKLDFLQLLPNVQYVTTYFNWNLIEADPDDNKFVDAAVAGNADFLVSNDRHFRVLKQVDFPVVPVLRLEEFINQMNQAE